MYVFSEWVVPESLLLGLYACRRLDGDCRHRIVSWLPLRVCCACDQCGLPIAMMDEHGGCFLSSDMQYSYTTCRWCYFRECC